MKRYEFDAVLQKHDTIDATYIEFPYDVEKEFGVKGQVKVQAAFDGYEYQGSLAKMGHHCHFLIVTQKIRTAIGKKSGDTIHVMISKDTSERTIAIPEDFLHRLEATPETFQFFNSLSFTNRKEYVVWITNAKKDETRMNRLDKAIKLLEQSVKHP